MPSHKKHSNLSKNTDINQDTKPFPESQNNPTIKPLIALPSVRDLSEVKQAVKNIKNIDKLWIKYTPSPVAYPLMRSEFLAHPNNYTHLIVLPDDLVVEPDKLECLLNDYETALSSTEDEKDTTILTGYCNVDVKANNDKANICTETVLPNRNGRRYNWVLMDHLRTLKNVIDRNEENNDNDSDNNSQTTDRDYLIPIKFAGFPLCIIPRKIVEQIPFRDDSSAQYRQTGVCYDVMFCHDALEKGFQLMTDIRVDLKHLRYTKESDVQLQLQRMREKDGFRRVSNHPMVKRQIEDAQQSGEIDYLFKPHLRYEYADNTNHISLIEIPEIKNS